MKLTRREKGAIVFLAALAALATVAWRPVSRQFLTHLLIRADAVSQETVDELADASGNPDDLLQRLWNSEKIPHRLAVVNYLEKRSTAALPPKLQTILIEGCRDVNFEVRELALRLLARQKFPGLPVQSQQQLRDADPAVRLLAFEHLRKNGDPKLLPVLVPILDDPDPSVQASAGSLLQKWSGCDFGIRISQALPQFSRPDPKALEPDKLEVLQRGVQSAKAWWESHKADFPTSPDASVPPTVARRLPVADFTLLDLNAKPIRLAGLRGKTVLLNFWDTATPACRALITNLTEIGQSKPDGVVILGISLETTISERDHKHEHEEHEGKHPHHHAPPPPDLDHVRAQLRSYTEQNGIEYPVLVDADGMIARRYAVQDVPTTVLIDAEGFVRRRFMGNRRVEALQAMVADIRTSR